MDEVRKKKMHEGREGDRELPEASSWSSGCKPGIPKPNLF